MTSKRLEMVADFETITDPDDCRVWGYGIAEISLTPRVVIGNNIDDFMKYVAAGNTTVYFHNLKFDGKFILDWLLRHDYNHVDGKPIMGEFTTMISDMGMFYDITVRFHTGHTVSFRDSYKKLPMSADAVAKAFKLDIAKGSIDYEAYRAPGHVLTAGERDYLTQDVAIIARALHKQLHSGMTRMTVGSDSLHEFRKSLGSKTFKRLFPVLPETMDAQARLAYRGGWTYADERFRRKMVGPGAVYDVNSLYPSVMRAEPMPYGVPKWFDDAPPGPAEWPLFIVSITFTATLKDGHLPCIQVKRNPRFMSTEYQKVIADPVTLVCTSVDLELWEKHYDMDIISYNGGFMFRQVDNVFDTYIDKWMEVKRNSDGGSRTIAKLFLNSLYGKFATNPEIRSKVPYMADNIVKYRSTPLEHRDPVYTPVGVFITAYARRVTITAAQANYDTFAYADTDSLHLLTQDAPQGIVVDPDALGAWKHEYDFDAAVYLRAKQYGERLPDGRHELHIAGAQARALDGITLEDLKPGLVLTGGLKPRTVPGGVVLTPHDFTLE